MVTQTVILADKRHEVRLGRRQETEGAKLYRLRSLDLILGAMNSHCRILSEGATGSELQF